MLRGIVSCAFLVCLLPWGTTAWAEPFAEAVADILRAAEMPSPAAYRSATARFDEAEQMVAGDVRPPLALALAALRNQRLDDADAQLSTARERSPHSHPAMRLTLWLALLRKQYDQAGVQIASLDRLLAAATAAQAMHPEFQETARLLGRATAFLKGPGSTPLLEKKLAAWAGPATAAWPQPLAAAFEEGRAAVAKDHAAAQDELSLAKKEALAKNNEKLTKERQMHADQVDVINARQTAIEQEREDFRAKNEARYKMIKDRLAMLEAQLAPLTHLRTLLEKTDDALDKERKATKDDKNKPRSSRYDSLLTEATRLRAEIGLLEPPLRPLEAEAKTLRPIASTYL